MPRPAHRTRMMRRIHITTPGGAHKVHYEKRKPGKATCANCGRPLAGVPRGRPVIIRNLSLSKKRPNRRYGGVLCPSCLALLIKQAVRATII